jgi:hypothetical protein
MALQRRLGFIAMVTLIALAGCAAGPSSPSPDDPRAVVDAFLAARDSGDGEAAMQYVADGVDVSLVRFGLSTGGKDQLRLYLTTPGVSFQPIGAPTVEGDYVSWIERVVISADPVWQADDPDGSLRAFRVEVQAHVAHGQITSLLEKDVTVRCPYGC